MLPTQIIRHEIEGDCEEKRETEFGNYVDDFVYGFYSWYTLRRYIYGLLIVITNIFNLGKSIPTKCRVVI